MAAVRGCSEGLKTTLRRRLTAYEFHETESGCYLTTPFLDPSGDALAVRIQESPTHCVMDDSGYVAHVMSRVAPNTAALRQAESLLRGLVGSFGATLNHDDGTVQLVSAQDRVTESIVRFIQLFIALDTVVGQLSFEGERQAARQRPTLGPRASTKIAKEIKPALDQNLIQRRAIVDGKAYSAWPVDFIYEPRKKLPIEGVSRVVVLGVDLAVQEPLLRASDAFMRVVDIKSAHQDYDIRVAVDPHGKNGMVDAAKKLLLEHQLDTKAYSVFDLGDRTRFADLTSQIRYEVGELLSL